MCKMFTKSPRTLTFCPFLSWLNNLFMARFQLIRMSSYAKNKLQMCSVTQHQCGRRQMCGKCSQIHPVHSLFVRYKNDLSWLNNLFVARFQLISMSSYANNKLQMCSVTQHQCRWRQKCGKCSQIHQEHSLFVRTCPDWTIYYSWQTFNSLGCPLMLRTNYRCVQSLNISVDVAKCVENVHKFTQSKSECNELMCEHFAHVWRRLHWCWVTEHICSLFLT